MSQAEVSDTLAGALELFAVRWTGMRSDAIRRSALRSAAESLLASGRTAAEVIAHAGRGDPTIVETITAAVCVGETSFFRHPEHFRILDNHVSARWAGRKTTIRAWSAGCATGEEAYSITACLNAAVSSFGTQVEVLGTDLLVKHVEAARKGEYGPWSVRAPGAPLYPVFGPQALRVREDLRRLTRFQVHNLLDEPGLGSFDVIFCRNVLIYLRKDAARRSCQFLVKALAPGGVLILGPVDLAEVPSGLVATGPKGAPCFTTPDRQGPHQSANSSSPRSRRSEISGSSNTLEPLVLHRGALEHIEEGRTDQAEEVLALLRAAQPEYLPAAMELALLHNRTGKPAPAVEIMKQVLRRASELPPEHLVPGPELLPAKFYLASARTFLDRVDPQTP